LESKWGTIKHDVGKFIGAYNQIKKLNKSGTKEADIIRMAKDLYRTKTAKNIEFMFEHCWELVKDFPRWADGVSPSRQTTPSRRLSGSSDHESQSGSQVDTQKSVSAVDIAGEATTSMPFSLRPGGTKAAKDAQRADKFHERAALTQAKAAEKMAEATLRKAASLEYHNMLLLFTAPMDQVTKPEAQEYIRLLREEELVKLRRRRAESATVELREQQEREVLELAEAAQEQEEAEKRAREDEETLRQMREARVESDYEHPVNKDVVDLRESDEEDPHQYEVSSNSTSSPAPVQTYTV
jgi:DNA-binding transcriptional ArsR family regulator